MRTLLFTLEYPPFKGGIANYYANLANFWPIGEDLIILDNNQGQLLEPCALIHWRPAFWALNRKIDKSKIDYVIAGQILPLGTVAYILSFFRPLRYAVFLHGMDLSFALKIGRKKFLSRLILKRADKILCANTYVAEQAINFYPGAEDKIVIVNPGVPALTPELNPGDLEKLKSDHNLEGKINLLSIGRLVKRKGFDQVIKALEQIPSPLIDRLQYFIAGIGPDAEYFKKSVPAKLANKIIFLEEISEYEKWLWLIACDIFVMTSRNIAGDYEGFGIVYMEANLCAKPVIAGNVGGVKDAVVNNLNGILLDSENINEIKEAIIQLAEDPELRKKNGEAGQNRAIKDFNWEKQSAKLAKALK